MDTNEYEDIILREKLLRTKGDQRILKSKRGMIVQAQMKQLSFMKRLTGSTSQKKRVRKEIYHQTLFSNWQSPFSIWKDRAF